MKGRINIQKLVPKAYQAMFRLDKYLNSIGLSKRLKELIKIRASQIDGCAYCIEFHTKEAIENSESQRRIFALSAWRKSPLFWVSEKVVLKMTDKVTLISAAGLKIKPTRKLTCIFLKMKSLRLLCRYVPSIHGTE